MSIAKPLAATSAIAFTEAGQPMGGNLASASPPQWRTPTTAYVVSRHTGAVEWVRRRLGETANVKVLAHVGDEQVFAPGDKVCGVLPLALAARICAQGAKPYVIDIKLTADMRGRELSADELEALQARLVRYEVKAFAEC
jgi:CRISPR-associated protein Csx16